MILEMILVSVVSIVTTLVSKRIFKIIRIRSQCSKCCNVEISTQSSAK